MDLKKSEDFYPQILSVETFEFSSCLVWFSLAVTTSSGALVVVIGLEVSPISFGLSAQQQLDWVVDQPIL